MIRLIQGANNLRILNDEIDFIRCVEIAFSGKIHAESLLPESWQLFANNKKIICLNLGDSDASEIINFEGEINIHNVYMYDGNSVRYKAKVIIERANTWEEYNDRFDLSSEYYENLFVKGSVSSGVIKSTKIVRNNLNTSGNEFYLVDGSSYQGDYHMHEDGQAMTGGVHNMQSVNIYRKDSKGRIVDTVRYKRKNRFYKSSLNLSQKKKIKSDEGTANKPFSGSQASTQMSSSTGHGTGGGGAYGGGSG